MIDNSKEYIICAAIWYKELKIPDTHNCISMALPRNCNVGIVFCGHRHPHCMYSMISIFGIRSVESECGEYIQGFLSSKNKFYNRYESAEIAYNAGQIPEKIHKLHSEDIY